MATTLFSSNNCFVAENELSSPLSRSTLIDCRKGAGGWVRQDVHSVLLSYWSTRLAGTPSSWYMLRAISKLRLRRPCKMSLNVVGDTPMAAAASFCLYPFFLNATFIAAISEGFTLQG